MRTFSITAILMALSACNGGKDCSDCSGSGEDLDGDGQCDTCDDSGTDPTGTAIINMAVLKLDVEEACLVNLIGSNSYVADSSTDLEVDAPDTYVATAGDSALTPQFGFPIHVDAAGEYWAAEPQDVEVEADQVKDGEFHLFNLFEPGIYACEYDKYEFDASAEDKKGDYQRTVELDPQHIAVDEYGQIQAQDDPNMGGVGSGDDEVKAEDDHLVLVVADSDFTVYITTSEIGKDFFSLTVVSETGLYVFDLICVM